MMRIILIRHGSREEAKTSPDKDMPLSDEGKKETYQLGGLLSRLALKPEVFLTSKYRHAKEMGESLARQLDGTSPASVITLDALTPHSTTSTFEDLIDEAEKAQIILSQRQVIAIVGHEARLSQLLTRLTSARARPFNRAEAASVIADSFHELLQGRGRVEFRIPVADYQEDRLRQKIQSKMTVSTFLAGFTVSTLMLYLSGPQGGFSGFQRAAAICLTAALALFIVAVYMYRSLD